MSTISTTRHRLLFEIGRVSIRARNVSRVDASAMPAPAALAGVSLAWAATIAPRVVGRVRFSAMFAEFEMANPGYQRLVGTRDIIGKPVKEALPEVVEQREQPLPVRVPDGVAPGRLDQRERPPGQADDRSPHEQEQT